MGSHIDIDDHGDHVIGPTTGVATKVSLVLKIHVSDMGRSIKFYEAIGATIEFRSVHRSIMRISGAMLALHLATGDQFADRKRVGLSMVSLVPLRAFTAELHHLGIAAVVIALVAIAIATISGNFFRFRPQSEASPGRTHSTQR